MTTDIVEQLRSVDGAKDAGFVIDLCWEAATEIERLRGLLRQAHGVIDHGPASDKQKEEENAAKHDHSECRKSAAQQVRSVQPGMTTEEYWQRVRETTAPYFWNRIAATLTEQIPDSELAAKIAAAKGDVNEIIALIRQGGKRERTTRLCEWCNKPVACSWEVEEEGR